MKYILNISSKLPSLNDYINKCRRNKYAGAKFKKDIEELINWHIKVQLQNIHIDKPVSITFNWKEDSRRRDLDNIYSAKKYILDALVKSGVLQNDTQRWVTELKDTIEIGNGYGVVVEIEDKEV